MKYYLTIRYLLTLQPYQRKQIAMVLIGSLLSDDAADEAKDMLAAFKLDSNLVDPIEKGTR